MWGAGGNGDLERTMDACSVQRMHPDKHAYKTCENLEDGKRSKVHGRKLEYATHALTLLKFNIRNPLIVPLRLLPTLVPPAEDRRGALWNENIRRK